MSIKVLAWTGHSHILKSDIPALLIPQPVPGRAPTHPGPGRRGGQGSKRLPRLQIQTQRATKLHISNIRQLKKLHHLTNFGFSCGL